VNSVPSARNHGSAAQTHATHAPTGASDARTDAAPVVRDTPVDRDALAFRVEQSQAMQGVIFGLAAYLWWGVVPVYFKAVAAVPALEVLAHRVIWSVVLLGFLMRVFRRWPGALASLRDRMTLLTLVGSTTLIALNWLTFIWAVASGKLLQASLGYYINPLVNVLLGFVFLSERLRAWQWVSVGLAAVSVTYLTSTCGVFPWVALVLAVSFGFYGLLRKIVRLDSLSGLTLETLILSPLMFGYWFWLMGRGDSAMQTGAAGVKWLLPLSGIVTAVPLLFFAGAARRLRLATIGFLQYIAPTMHFTLAVAVFGESFTPAHALCFAMIWIALTVYSIDAVLASRRSRIAAPAPR